MGVSQGGWAWLWGDVMIMTKKERFGRVSKVTSWAHLRNGGHGSERT